MIEPCKIIQRAAQKEFNELPFITEKELVSGFCMGPAHPTRQMSRTLTTDVERQNINVRHDLAEDIDTYLRQLEK